MLIIPEVIFQKLINQMIKVIKDDYNSKTNKPETLLYVMFKEDDYGEEVKLDDMEFYKSAIDLFVTANLERSRNLEVSIGYNLNRQGCPTIHVMLPNESPGLAGIGANEGYEDHIIDQQRRMRIPVYTGSTQVTYNLIITSENMNEVLIIYHWLKAMSLSMTYQFELRGFKNVVFGGSDLNISEDLVPPNIFHRNFNVSFTYDFSSPDVLNESFARVNTLQPTVLTNQVS